MHKNVALSRLQQELNARGSSSSSSSIASSAKMSQAQGMAAAKQDPARKPVTVGPNATTQPLAFVFEDALRAFRRMDLQAAAIVKTKAIAHPRILKCMADYQEFAHVNYEALLTEKDGPYTLQMLHQCAMNIVYFIRSIAAETEDAMVFDLLSPRLLQSVAWTTFLLVSAAYVAVPVLMPALVEHYDEGVVLRWDAVTGPSFMRAPSVSGGSGARPGPHSDTEPIPLKHTSVDVAALASHIGPRQTIATAAAPAGVVVRDSKPIADLDAELVITAWRTTEQVFAGFMAQDKDDETIDQDFVERARGMHSITQRTLHKVKEELPKLHGDTLKSTAENTSTAIRVAAFELQSLLHSYVLLRPGTSIMRQVPSMAYQLIRVLLYQVSSLMEIAAHMPGTPFGGKK
jgi:hypothetical protein